MIDKKPAYVSTLAESLRGFFEQEVRPCSWSRRGVYQKSATGFLDANAKGKSEWVLLEDVEATPIRTYEPLEVPSLYRTFAQTEKTKERILEFANQFGVLGSEQSYTDDKKAPLKVAYAERLADWAFEIERIGQVIELADAFKASDRNALRKLIRWNSKALTGGFFAVVPNLPESEIWKFSDLDREAMILEAAETLLSMNIDIMLAATCSPTFWLHGNSSLSISPNCLLGALWWQLASDLMGRVQFRPCKFCGAMIKISKEEEDGARANREFCSGNCQQGDHRRKRKKARELWASGKMTPQEIAEAVEARLFAVKNWLRNRKRGSAS